MKTSEDRHSIEAGKNEVIFPTQRQNSISATNANRLMLFREIIRIYCGNHRKKLHFVENI